jgi:hypothetical protein
MATVRQDIDLTAGALLGSAFAAWLNTLGTNFPVPGWRFDAATQQHVFFKLRASSYGSGNLTLTITWYADTASANDAIFGAAIAAITPNTDTQDVETDSLATAQTVTDTHLGTTGQRLHQTDLTISNLDSLSDGDEFWLQFYRDADAGGDTLTGYVIVTGLSLTYSDT